MAKDKERTVNPATASLKASKASAIKKQKAAIAAQRTQRLATRNPTHLSNQIQSLKEEKEVKGRLPPQQQKRLETLEREVEGVKKAREKLGPPVRGGERGEKRKFDERKTGGGGGGSNPNRVGLGRDRGRWGRHEESESDETDPEVREIPMPRDTPPPIPPKPRREYTHFNESSHQPRVRPSDEPLPPINRDGPHPLPAKPTIAASPAQPAKAVYESAPVIRDLRKEATAAFMPAAVLKRRQEQEKEKQRLKEPEELDAEEARDDGEVRGQDGNDDMVHDQREETARDEQMEKFLGEVDMADGGESDAQILPERESTVAPTTRKLALVEDYDSDDD
ncbi:MAG: hypothetical protein M1828_002700 [Chrysothrix sp. TS-e1954]|nr:MAG: hypothetical protein M1828_002700 [Chrysothrix sp. TS-e1954]